MASATKTLRLRDSLRSEIDGIARRSRRSFSEVTQDLIEEALKMRKCPGIYFADEPGGREAKIAGTGLGVWEVMTVYKAVSQDTEALRKRLSWLNDAQVQAALLYYRECAEEIDALVADNEEASLQIPHAGLSRRGGRA